jgi:hypothetical protein
MLHYGNPITKAEMAAYVNAPNFVQQLNARIAGQLEQLAYVNRTQQSDTPEHGQMMHHWQQAEKQRKDVLGSLYANTATAPAKTRKRWFTKAHLSIIGLPHYWLSKAIARKLTKGSVFYDSIFFGLVLFAGPLYLLTVLVVLICYFI